MKNECKCRFCYRYDDLGGCCKLNREKHSLDEVHTCSFADGAMGEFHSLIESLKEVVKSLSDIEGSIGRCVNTDKEEKLTEKFVGIRNLAEETIKSISERPDEYRTIQEHLGNCGNCKHLDRTKHGFDGYHIYGTCEYSPNGYDGRIYEESWRGCAKWERK